MWLIVAIFYGLDYLQHTMPSVLILPISQSIGVDYVSITDIMNVYFPIYALSQIPAGYFIDRFGLRMALFGASLILSSGLWLMSLPVLHCILIGRIAIAIGSSFAWIGGLKATATYLPKHLFPLMTGLLNSMGVLMGTTGLIFINHVVNLAGWQPAIYGVSLFGFAWSLVLVIFLSKQCISNPAPVPTLSQLPREQWLAVFKHKHLWCVVIYAALITSALMSTFAESYSVIALNKLQHASSSSAAWLNSLIFIGVGTGGPVHGLIARQFKNKLSWLQWTAWLASLCYIVFLFLLHSHAPLLYFALSYFMIGFFVSGMLLSYTLAKDMFTEKVQGVVFSFINMVVMLMGFVTPLLFGFIIHFSKNTLHSGTPLALPLTLLLIPMLMACLITHTLKNKTNAQ